MQCPKCKTENREDARFCLKCGASLALVCRECGRELPPQAEFCDGCGSRVRAAEPAPAATTDAFAQRLQRLVPKEYAERLRAAGGQVAGERRTVTILFCDVKGSTAMAEDLDPEDWTEIMEGAFDVLIEPVYRYEGTLARLMGDAVLAFFGAPIAHEDDPERACRAALEITARAAEYAEKLEKERGIKGFNVRVGINTGLVVVGEVGTDLRVEYTAMGDAINLAARMESAAEPGTVWITENTYKLIAPLFETEALGRIEVKGKAEPAPVYRVLAAKELPGKVRGIAGLESPLVGRKSEFAALQEAVERLQAGVGGIVTIVGEAGIGKSRLVAEVRNLPDVIASPYSGEAIPPREGGDCFPVKESSPPCGANGGEGMPRHRQTEGEIFDNDKLIQWVEGRCLSYGTTISYLLWLDVLRGWLGVTLEDPSQAVRDRLREQLQILCPERLDDVYPYLARLMSLPLTDEQRARLDDMEGQELKVSTFEAVETLIARAAEHQPLALVCEDLHWADPASLELLERLLALTDRGSLLFICVFRPEPEHGSWRLREVAARQYRHRHTDLWLQPLSAGESNVLVGNLLRLEQLPPALKQRILDAAEGNPFYVEEIIRSMIDQGAIVRDDATGRWQATESAVDIPIPDTLHGVLVARIDRLQEDTKRVLQMASVIGRFFLYRVLELIAQEERQLEERQLDEHLLALQREEMIRERARIPELEYIFKHDLTREAAYNGLLKVQRRIFHRQVAEALEQLFSERIEEHVGLLAHHWERAADAEKATAYLLRAGDQARLLYAHREAIDFYQRALAFLREQEQHERAARTLMKLGLTYHTAFDFARSRQAYEEAFAMWQRAGAEQREPAVSAPTGLQTLRVQYFFELALDPATGSASGEVIEQLFSGLVEQTPDMDIVPDVAQSWEVSQGGLTYVFHLRDDVCWSDGIPVTAEDFCLAWRRVLDPASGSPHASLLFDVRRARAFHRGQVRWEDVGVRAIDAGTLVVELEGPTGYFLQLLAYLCALPVPRHVVQAHGMAWAELGNIVTNGPFRLQAWDRGESMTLVRNPAYHGRFSGNVQRVELYSSADPSAQLEMYETDRLDRLSLWSIPMSEMDRARQRHAGEFLSVPKLSTVYLAFNTRRPPFDDVRVRRAFVMAIDWAEFASVILGGYAFAATGGFVPPGMPGHSPGIALPYDPDRARQLLSEAGYAPGGSREFPAVELLGDLVDGPPSKYLQTQLREKMGIEVTVTLFDSSVFLQRLKEGRSHMWALGWGADYPDPDSFLRAPFLREQIGWRNETYERLVEEARRLTDHGERMRLYRQADRILMHEAPIKPACYSRKLWLVKPWISKYPMSALRDSFWKDVIIEPH